MTAESPEQTKKPKFPSESFIFVRPPPSKSNHPLNLQVQLVPPRPDSASASSSTTSLSSSSSTRRAIIPLYNLQAHNVLPNVIIDAGTEAKIARFHRRGIDMIDLAVFEPVEVWSDRRTSVDVPRPVSPASSAASLPQQQPPQPQEREPPPVAPSPTPKRTLFGKIFPNKPMPFVLPTIPSPIEPEETTPKKLRFRNRLSALLSPSTPVFSSPTPASTPVTAAAPPAAPSPNPSRLSFVTDGGDLQLPPTPDPRQLLVPPVLGIQPTFVSSSPLPKGSSRTSVIEPEHVQGQRPLLYVWLLKRWLKKSKRDKQVPNSALSAFFNTAKDTQEDGYSSAIVAGSVEVRFEWKRAKGKESKRQGSRRPRRQRTDDTATSIASDDRDQERERKRRNRLSTASYASSMESGSMSGLQRSSTGGHERDRDEESDAEDSETPWVCTLKLRRIAPFPGSASQSQSFSPSNGGGGGGDSTQQTVRIKVGTLSPTPHHPKVVGMLKIPFPLPDIEVETMGLRNRKPTPNGSPQASEDQGNDEGNEDNQSDGSSDGEYKGLVLTAEEIKDVVCSTGMWLVVREGFGGVGKVSRKGDGWRLRP